MKTIEQKAKAYDEVLKKIQPLYEQAKKDDNPIWSTYEYLFPKLRKSVDERMMREFNDWLCEEIECRTNDLRDEKDRRTLGMLCYVLTNVKEWLEKQKEQKPTPDWMPKFLDELRSKKNYFDWDEHRDIEGHILAIINWIAPNYFDRKEKEHKPNVEICPHSIKSKSYKENGYPIENCDYGLEIAYDILEKTFGEVRGYQTDDGIREHQTAIKAVKDAIKEQKQITESRRLANEVIEYLTRCGYSPVLKDDSKKEHFHIDIPRHEDDFWHSEEYKHCRSVLGEYYMEGDYGSDTYTLYIWRAKKEQKPVEWSEENEETLACAISVFEDFAECKNVSVPPASAKRYLNRLKSLRSQPREEIYHSAKHDLAIRFMNYLDENRPEGKMNLSNEECEDIDKAFKENDWAKIMRYVEKYRPYWKPSEEQMEALLWCTAHLGGADHRILAELYEHLKKLM